MKINDLEKLLGVKRSNIFYYEREGLVSPRREDNNYREYDEEDLRRLKAIIVFRKLGFTVEEIRSLFGGERALSDILPENMERLAAQARELEAARRLCRDMERQGVTMDGFDPEGWYDTIEEQERSGQRFMDILGDAADDVTRSMAFLQRHAGVYGPVYANYILSEEGIKRRRPLKWYWLILALCCVIALLADLLTGAHTARSTIVLYVSAGLVVTVTMALCGRFIIPGRPPQRALALTVAITLAAELCLIPLFIWAGPRLDGRSYGRLGATVEDPVGYVQAEFSGGRPVDVWEDGDLMIVLTSWGRSFQFRRTDDGLWAQYEDGAPVEGVVYTSDPYGPEPFPSRLMLSDGTVAEPVYEARFDTGYVPLFAFDVSRGQSYRGLLYGVGDDGAPRYVLRTSYTIRPEQTMAAYYNQPGLFTSYDQEAVLSVPGGAAYIAGWQAARAALWGEEPITVLDAAYMGLASDSLLYVEYMAPPSLTVGGGGTPAAWGRNEFCDVVRPGEQGNRYLWQMLCSAEILPLLRAEEMTPALLKAAAESVEPAGSYSGAGPFDLSYRLPYTASRIWDAAAVPEELFTLGESVRRALDG